MPAHGRPHQVTAARRQFETGEAGSGSVRGAGKQLSHHSVKIEMVPFVSNRDDLAGKREALADLVGPDLQQRLPVRRRELDDDDG